MVIEPPAAELADTHCWNEAAGLVLTFRPDSISPMVCCWLLIGMDAGSPVSPDYGPQHNEFSGEVNWVQIDLEKDDHDHLITPDERLKLAMARQ